MVIYRNGVTILNLNNEKYILTIVQESSISKAAKKLFISQPALSQTIKFVEKEFEIKIFSRKGKFLELTPEGEKYIEFIKKLVLMERNFHDEIKDMQNTDIETIRFGISTQLGKILLHTLINEFEKLHPNVKFDIELKGSIQLEKMISEDLLDIAITSNMSSNWNLTYDFLSEELIGILAGENSISSKIFKNGEEISIKDTAESNYVFLTKGHYSRLTQDELFKANNITISNYIEVDSFEIGKNLAIGCERVMVVPYSLIEDDPVFISSKATFHPLKNISTKRNNYLTHRKNRYLSNAILDFIEIIKKNLE